MALTAQFLAQRRIEGMFGIFNKRGPTRTNDKPSSSVDQEPYLVWLGPHL